MKLMKRGRKWVVEGGSGWISKWTFPYKWKAIIGMEIAKNGGPRQDYFEAARKNRPEENYPYKAIEKMEEMLDDILEIKPTPDEISLYGKENKDAYGVCYATIIITG
jgi:hypothetical protein